MQNTINNRMLTLSDKIKTDLRIKLESGWLLPNEKFPSESTVAAEFGVTRMTARKAILSLIDAGILYRIPGRGTYAAGPDGVSHKMHRAKTKTILMIVPSLGLSVYNEVIQGVLDVMENRGYDMVLRTINDNPLQERRCLELADPDKYEGTILLGVLAMQSNRDTLDELCKKIPVVIVDEPVEGLGADCVYTDDVYGAFLATSHLIELGHRKIAHIAAVDDKLQGYRQALEKHGIEYDEDIVRFTHWKLSEGYSETTKLMLNHKDITAIFAANDVLAAGTYQALTALNLKVPDDVALVGYGDLDISELLGVKLTTVNQNPRKMGDKAGSLLIEKLSGSRPASDRQDVIIPIRIVTRESCGILNPMGR